MLRITGRWKSMGCDILLAGVVVQSIVWALVSRGPVAVPGLDGWYAIVWPLVPLLCAATVPFAFEFRNRPEIQMAGRFAILHTLLQWIAANVVLAAFGIWFEYGHEYVRNQLLAMGIAASLASILRPQVASLACILLGMIAWMFGSSVVHPAPWNLFAHSATSVPALAVAILMFLAGGAALSRRSIYS